MRQAMSPADPGRPGSFDDQPVLDGPTLHLRPLAADDLDGLAAAASDPETWAGHPARERYKRDVFEPYFRFLLDSGGTLAVRDRKNGEIIGCSRYYAPPDRPDGISIGFTFLRHAYSGGQSNFEMKSLMLDHAFERFPSVWFHIAPTNIRSEKATKKLGAVHAYDATLAFAGSSSDWMCFRLDREAWLTVREARRAVD